MAMTGWPKQHLGRRIFSRHTTRRGGGMEVSLTVDLIVCHCIVQLISKIISKKTSAVPSHACVILRVQPRIGYGLGSYFGHNALTSR